MILKVKPEQTLLLFKQPPKLVEFSEITCKIKLGEAKLVQQALGHSEEQKTT